MEWLCTIVCVCMWLVHPSSWRGSSGWPVPRFSRNVQSILSPTFSFNLLSHHFYIWTQTLSWMSLFYISISFCLISYLFSFVLIFTNRISTVLALTIGLADLHSLLVVASLEIRHVHRPARTHAISSFFCWIFDFFFISFGSILSSISFSFSNKKKGYFTFSFLWL